MFHLSISQEIKLILAKSIATLVVAGILIVGVAYALAWSQTHAEENDVEAFEDSACNVAVIRVEGEIATLPDDSETKVALTDDIVSSIKQAESIDHIKGMMFIIDSTGGGPVAGEIISNAIKKASKPTVAVIREYGASSAYLIATGADLIVASPMSYVGGIGVTGSYVETAGQTEKEGGVFVGITGGVLKDAGNSDKHITKEERAMLQRNVDILHEEFIKKVSENRNIPIEDVKKLADGSDMPGRMALENKLIDAVGDEDTALEWLKMKMNGEEVITCE